MGPSVLAVVGCPVSCVSVSCVLVLSMQSPKVRNGASLGTRIGGACNHEFLATHDWPPKVAAERGPRGRPGRSRGAPCGAAAPSGPSWGAKWEASLRRSACAQFGVGRSALGLMGFPCHANRLTTEGGYTGRYTSHSTLAPNEIRCRFCV